MKMCVCHRSKNQPYCDGSHNKILVEENVGKPFVRIKPEGKKEEE
jgi:CDGSH-type Zn-finger protein